MIHSSCLKVIPWLKNDPVLMVESDPPYDFCFDALLFLILNLSIMESDSFVHPR